MVFFIVKTLTLKKINKMIEIFLPIIPRTNVRAEYLTTEISVFSSPGVPVLNLTTMNFSSVDVANLATQGYIQVLNRLFKLNSIYVITDSQKDAVDYAKDVIRKSNVYISRCECLVCKCKKYEELSLIRSFNQRRVQNGVCMYCKSQLTLQETDALFIKIDWPVINFESFNFDWVKKDWLSFKSRQSANPYKVSKEVETTKLNLEGISFGIKHQLLWATQIAFISKTFGDNNIRIHFVERVKDLVFFVCSIAKTLNPQLLINLKGCPTVWLKEEKEIFDITSVDVEQIKKCLNSKRKEIST